MAYTISMAVTTCCKPCYCTLLRAALYCTGADTCRPPTNAQIQPVEGFAQLHRGSVGLLGWFHMFLVPPLFIDVRHWCDLIS
ncbi:hypothetical protein DL93DRAFT_575675 [Clavulina sp. PMI_390]|nr:hypothetical protein DL93DRAFT_575675 [Clavulina sp. PMI_390]